MFNCSENETIERGNFKSVFCKNLVNLYKIPNKLKVSENYKFSDKFFKNKF